MSIKIYTDGACSKNGTKNAVAGWGYIILDGNNDTLLKTEYGSIKNGTNNIGEMTAIIEALKDILTINAQEKLSKEDYSNITIYTDSVYCLNGITSWIKNWQKNGWKSASGNPVKNQELWKQMNELVYNSNLSVDFVKVKGHAGDYWNEQVDILAKKGGALNV